MTRPAAQAVLEAALGAYWCHDAKAPADAEVIAAAVLRAFAARLEDYDPPCTAYYPEAQAFVDGKCVRNSDIYSEIIAIANELNPHDAYARMEADRAEAGE
jgi:hypothetical protein